MLDQDPKLAICHSSWGETALQAASHLGHRSLLSSLINVGVSVDLFAACAIGDIDTALELIRLTGPDVCGVHGLPILHFGVVGGKPYVLGILLAAGVPVNPKTASLSPLHSAVACGSLAMIHRLLLAGADPTAPDAFGATVLDWALDLEREGSEIVSVLTSNQKSTRAHSRMRGFPGLLAPGDTGFSDRKSRL